MTRVKKLGFYFHVSFIFGIYKEILLFYFYFFRFLLFSRHFLFFKYGTTRAWIHEEGNEGKIALPEEIFEIENVSKMAKVDPASLRWRYFRFPIFNNTHSSICYLLEKNFPLCFSKISQE